MSNRKLYILKVACARLHDLKVQERRYKGALVKRACMHLLVKQGADARYSDAKTYDELAASANPDDVRALENLRKKVDWKSGFWGTALGKFLRPYFENGEHDDAYKLFLTQHLDSGASEAQQEAAMMETLMNLGVEPSKWRYLIDSAKAWAKGRGQYVKDLGKEREAREKEQFLTDWGATESDYARKKKYGQEHGWIPKDDDKPSQGYYGGPGWLPRSSGYLTDQQAMYDPEFGRAWGLGGRGAVINNYYYGTDVKRQEVPPEAGKPSDPSKPGATTPGPGLNPDLLGSSIGLGTSNTSIGYLGDLGTDAKHTTMTLRHGVPVEMDGKPTGLSMPGDMSLPSLPSGLGMYSADPVVSGGSFGSTSLTTTGDPNYDLGLKIDPEGTLRIDPSIMSSARSEPTPETSPTLGAIKKGKQIFGDLAGILPGGSKVVNRLADLAENVYNNAPDMVKEVSDQTVTGANDMVSGSGGYDPSKPWTGAPSN